MPSASQTRATRIHELVEDMKGKDAVYEKVMVQARLKWPELSYSTLDDYVRSVLDILRREPKK